MYESAYLLHLLLCMHPVNEWLSLKSRLESATASALTILSLSPSLLPSFPLFPPFCLLPLRQKCCKSFDL